MSATLIERSYHETIKECTHSYVYDDMPGAGFGFDCDQDGKPILTNDASRKNYEACQSGEVDGRKVVDMGLIKYERTVFHPAVYQCECGEKFAGEYDHQCKCGRWYNAGGQELDAHAMVCSAYAAGYDCMCGENDE